MIHASMMKCGAAMLHDDRFHAHSDIMLLAETGGSRIIYPG